MPASYTHHLFTNDVFKTLAPSTKIKIENSKELFNLFGKSFDILFFIKPSLGIYAHEQKVNLYFKNIILYIKKNNLTNNSQVLAYLYGSICHYVLDSTIHPYVYYKTGKYNVKDKKSKKYRGKHNNLEFMIDAILYEERNHKKIYKAKMKNVLFSKIKYSNELKETINQIYKDTFQTKNGFRIINRGIKNYKFSVNHIMCSRYGIKHIMLKILEIIPYFKKINVSSYNYHIKKLNKNVLNEEHKKWVYPVDKKISFHYSFYDLYDISIEKARKLIEEINIVLDNEEKEINKVIRDIGNNSYASGKNANKNYSMKYFEF